MPYCHAAAFIVYYRGNARQVLLLDCKNPSPLRCAFSDRLVYAEFDNVDVMDDIFDEDTDTVSLYALERKPVPEADVVIKIQRMQGIMGVDKDYAARMSTVGS